MSFLHAVSFGLALGSLGFSVYVLIKSIGLERQRNEAWERLAHIEAWECDLLEREREMPQSRGRRYIAQKYAEKYLADNASNWFPSPVVSWDNPLRKYH